jgi:hypothetical protein
MPGKICLNTKKGNQEMTTFVYCPFGHCVVFNLRILITPLVSSNSSCKAAIPEINKDD